MTKRAAIYCRISRDSAGTAHGVKRQEKDCRAHCLALGWSIAGVFTDNDTSAYSGKPRPEYERMLTELDAGRIDAIVAWHPDRLHRSPKELESFITLVDARGTAVATVTAGDYDLATPEGRVLARIVGAIARKESEDKSRRLRRKHLELAEEGKLSGGGRRPFGYEADRVTIREDEAAEIRRAVDAILAGQSLRSVTLDLKERGVATVTGAAWSPTTVRRLVTSPRIAGQRSHHGRAVGAAEWPAIVDPDEVLRVRAILEAPRGTPGGTARKYLLSGFVTCGECASRMTARPVKRKGHTYRRYVCAVDRGGCGRVGIGAEPLEIMIVDALVEAIDRRRLAKSDAEAERSASKVGGSTLDIEVLDNRQRELAEMFAAGDIGRTEWLTARDAIEKRLAEAQARIATEARDVASVRYSGDSDVLREDWPDMSLEARRSVIAGYVAAVHIARTTRSNNRFDPARVTITWTA